MDRPYEKRNKNAEYIESWGNGGFCFFLYKPEDWIAFRFAHENIICLRIKYKDGLGKHIERNFLEGESIEIALCKSFKLIDNEENKKYHF